MARTQRGRSGETAHTQVLGHSEQAVKQLNTQMRSPLAAGVGWRAKEQQLRRDVATLNTVVSSQQKR